MAKNTRSHVFIDANVIIDFIEHRHFITQLTNKKPALNANKALDFLFQRRELKLYISSLSIVQLISYFQGSKKRRRLSIDLVREGVTRLLSKCEIIDLCEKDITEGMSMESADLEDNIQYIISQKRKCFYIVTNNHKDFKEFANVEIVKPDKIRSITV